MFSRKIIVFCCLMLTVTLLFWFSWVPLSSLGMEWYIQKEIHKRLGSHLQTEKIIRKDRSVIFESPILIHNDSAIEAPPRFQAEQIEVSYDYSLWGRKINIQVAFSNPTFTLDSKAETFIKEFVNEKAKRFKYFHVDWEVSIPRGTLIQKNQPPAFLTLKAQNKEILQGEFNFQFGSEVNPEGTFKGNFISDKEGGYSVALDFFQTPLAQINQGIYVFDGSARKLYVHKGNINGKVDLYLNKKKPPEFNGELAFDNIQIEYPAFKISCDIPKAVLSKKLDEFTLFEGCRFHLGKACQASSFKGAAQLSQEGEITLNFEGEGKWGQNPCTYLIQGKTSSVHSKSPFGWEISPDDIRISITQSTEEPVHSELHITRKEIDRQPENQPKNPLTERVTQISFEGDSTHFIDMLPESIGNTIRKNFAHKQLSIQTIAKKNSPLYSFDSIIQVRDIPPNQNTHTIHVGFELKKTTMPSHNFESLKLNAGSFSGKNIPLHLLIEPLISPYNLHRLFGETDFSGTFDSQKLSIAYQSKAISLENEHFLFETNEMAIGQHVFDFSKRTNSGTLLLKNGHYQDKKSALQFTDINTLLKFEKEHMLSGNFSGGKLNFSSEDFTFANLAFDFHYDHKAKTLLMENLQGSALLGKSEDPEEYSLSGNYIRINNLSTLQAQFDFLVKSKQAELLRLIGQTRNKNANNKILTVYFDKDRSHINNVPPIRCELAFDPQWHVHHFHWEFTFDLHHLSNSLQGLSKTKLWEDLGLIRHTKVLTHSQGLFQADLKYNQDKDDFYFGFKSSGLQLGSHKINKFFLNGKKQNNIWSIDQLQIDQFSAAADIIKENQRWIFNFLGLRWGPSVLAGLKGEYLADRGSFSGDINLLEIDLPALKNISSLSDFVDKYHLKGSLKALGTFHTTFNPEKNTDPWDTHVQLTASIHNPELLGVAFKDIQNASCQLINNEKLIIKQLICPFKTENTPTFEKQNGFFSIETAEYDLNKNELLLDGTQFDIPVSRLTWMTNIMRQYFPSAIDISIEECIKNSKREGDLQGRISLKIAPDEHTFRLELAQGKYWWLDTEHEISHFALEKDPRLIKGVLRYRLENQPFWVFYQTEGPQFNHGRILFSDNLAALNEPPEPSRSLVLDWVKSPTQGFDILKAHGSCAGFTANLTKHTQRSTTKQTIPLVGNIALDLTRAINMFPQELREQLQTWQLDKEYTFTGQWELNKIDRVKHGNFSFQGGLAGHNIELKGYRFEFVQADAVYALNHVRFNNIILQDPSGFLQIDQLEGTRTPPTPWKFSMGTCEVTDFQPHELISFNNEPFGNNPSMLISKLKINQLQGFVGNPESFTGIGELYFNNRSRRVSQNPLFVIPTEIINRIGLDLSVLTPISGSVFFKIQDGKAIITKLKDVYSEGKLSKFNLAGSSSLSYMDFDGNLHLQIRMKHYNILFKLAELFTFNVTGTLQKPVYSINKQPRRGSKKQINEI